MNTRVDDGTKQEGLGGQDVFMEGTDGLGNPIEQQAIEVNEEDQSSVVSDLTDEEERFEQIRREKEADERKRKAEVQKRSLENLAKVILTPQKKKYLYLIANKDISAVLSFFWDLLQKDSMSNVQMDKLHSFVGCIFKLFFPSLEEAQVKDFAFDFVNSTKMRETSSFCQEEVHELLLYIADVMLEILDKESTATFFEFLRNRLTKESIVKPDETETDIQTTFEVQFYSGAECNVRFRTDFKFEEQPENVVYCSEKIVNVNEVVKSLEESIVVRLRPYDEVVPLGTVSDVVINSMKNSMELDSSFKILGGEKLSPFLSQQQSLFYTGFLFMDCIGIYTRFNPSLFSPYVFEQLKDKGGNLMNFNQRNIYRECFETDPIYKLTKRWKDKFEPPKPTEHEVHGKPVQEIFYILIKNKFRYNSISEIPEAIQDLDFKSSDTFPTVKSEDFEKLKTREEKLPYDNRNTMGDDLTDLVKERPFHILVHGMPKIGKSRFCEALAKKFDLELIDSNIFLKNFLEKVAKGEEEAEKDEEGNPIEFLKPYERQTISDLRNGGRIKHDCLLQIMNDEIRKLRTDHKGLVYEVNCFDNPTRDMNYMRLVEEHRLVLNEHSVPFNYIIDLRVPKENVFKRAFEYMENNDPENFTLTYASLTRMDINTDECEIMRKWSLFYKMDPVALHKRKVLRGLSQFSCEYAGRIFCFANEENRAAFFHNPAPYLLSKPELPLEYNIAIVGQKNTGKWTFANALQEIYGLKILDFGEFMQEKVDKQSKWEAHIPNNPESGSIHFSKNEFNEIKKGSPFEIKNLLPILLHDNGIAVYKRPPPPKEEDPNETEERLRKEEEDRKKKEEDEKKKKKKKKVEEEEVKAKETVVVLEDIPLNELVVKPNEKGVAPELKGYIFINFPINEGQIAAMKEQNIKLDRIVILREPESEEEPGSILTKRPEFFENTLWEDETAFIDVAAAAIKEGYEEEFVSEVQSTKIEETLIKIRQFVDPFFIKVEDDSTALPTDLGDNLETVPLGEYGEYCPVSMVNSRWLAFGKAEFELQVRGKRYRFYSEEAMKEFQDNIPKFVRDEEPLVPEPRIFMTGCSGSGHKTQMERLRGKLKVPVVHFRDEFMKVMEFQRKQRREKRRLMRGFKEPPEVEEDAEIKPYDPDQDPELDEEDPNYEKNKNELDVANLILGKLEAAIVNFRLDFPQKEPKIDLEEDDENKEPPADENPELLSVPVWELLSEIKKLPEVLIILIVRNKKELLKRKYREKKIRDIYDRKLEKIELLKKRAVETKIKEMEEERRQKKEDGEEIDLDAPLEYDRDEIIAGAGIPEAPDFKEMETAEKERIINLHSEQVAKLEELAEAMKDLRVNVVICEADKDMDKIFKKISHSLTDVLESRDSLLQRHKVWKIKDSEDNDALTKAKIVQNLLKSYTIVESRFGHLAPHQNHRAQITQDYPLVFENRVYYLGSEEEREEVSLHPQRYLRADPAPPKDIMLKPRIFYIGKYYSGKTTVAEATAKRLNLVYVSIPLILELFVLNKFQGKSKELLEVLSSGRNPTDEHIVQLLAIRLQFSDVVQQGFILDGFPQTKEQALLLYKNDIFPDFVVTHPMQDAVVKQRARNNRLQDLYRCDIQTVDERLVMEGQHLKDVVNLFTYNFGNVRNLMSLSTDSKILELVQIIEEFTGGRQKAAIGIKLGLPFEASKLSIKRTTILGSICPTLSFSPVSLKKFGAMEQMYLRLDPLVYYSRNYFLVKDSEQVAHFFAKPEQFAEIQLSPSMVAIQPTTNRIAEQPFELRGHCPVELLQRRVVLGRKNLALVAFNKMYCFSSLKAMRTFFKNPSAFLSLKLPDKVKVTELPEAERISKQKGDLTAYVQNELSKLIVKAINQLSKLRIKYPSISVQSTALKLMALCLKSSNPNKPEEYRQKYRIRMKDFVGDCLLAKQIDEEFARRGSLSLNLELRDQTKEWTQSDEDHFLGIVEDFRDLLAKLTIKNPQEYFLGFIR
jgi:adenylate kinase family enzyme/YHS domain-containing protein